MEQSRQSAAKLDELSADERNAIIQTMATLCTQDRVIIDLTPERTAYHTYPVRGCQSARNVEI